MGIRSLWKRPLQHPLLRVLPVIGALALAAIPSAASSRTNTAHQARNVPVAAAARVVSLNLTSKLRLIGRPGHVDYVKGTVSGTFSGTTSVRFVAIGSTGGEATFTIYPKSGGSLFGRSVTHGRVVGPTAYFSGTASITGGTGSWAHAHGTGLAFSGTVNRQNYHSTSVTHGTIRV
jgi:hypothetical protein